MLKNGFKQNPNHLKINIVFLLLLVSNIALYIGLFYYYSRAGIAVDINHFEYFSTVIPTIIILGIITSRFSKLEERDRPLYYVMYLIIITVLGLMSGYFSEKANTAVLFGSYLEMFRNLCVILIFILMALLLNPFKEMLKGQYTSRNRLIAIVIFALLGIYATLFSIDIGGAPANVRSLVVMISALFGGPFVGIPVGVISAAYCYSAGGVTALPCALATFISGIVGSLIFIWNGKKFPKASTGVVLMFLFTGFEMMLIVLLTPSEISFAYVQNIYLQMVFASSVGVAVFLSVARDQREKLKSFSGDEESIIDEIEDELDLKNEIKELKKEVKELKRELGRK